MAEDTSGVPEDEAVPHEILLIQELKSLPPAQVVTAGDLTLRLGVPDREWVTAALSLMAQGEPVVIEESPAARGWACRLAEYAEELELTRGQVLDQYTRLGAALQGLSTARVRLVAQEAGGPRRN